MFCFVTSFCLWPSTCLCSNSFPPDASLKDVAEALAQGRSAVLSADVTAGGASILTSRAAVSVISWGSRAQRTRRLQGSARSCHRSSCASPPFRLEAVPCMLVFATEGRASALRDLRTQRACSSSIIRRNVLTCLCSQVHGPDPVPQDCAAPCHRVHDHAGHHGTAHAPLFLPTQAPQHTHVQTHLPTRCSMRASQLWSRATVRY